MKRIAAVVLFLAVACTSTSVPADASEQKETVDLLALSPPKGWEKEVKANTFTVWTTTDKKKGTYCRIAVMLSTPSKGTVQQDFEHEWKTLVAEQYGVTQAPKVSGPRTIDGWQIQEGAAPFPFNGGVTTATLSTMTGHGKTLSIVALTNSADHSPAIRKVLASVELKKLGAVGTAGPADAPPPATKTAPVAAGRIPTGETPDLYPGSPGWLPSGRGVPIPAPRVVNGSPQGMWWNLQLRSDRAYAITTIFLADGTRASSPRPGAGTLFDVEGQRKQQGSTGVGTFRVKDGKITQASDGFTNTNAFTSGTNEDGAWLDIGGGRYGACELLTAKSLVGTWDGLGARYVFRADGTYESGHVVDTGEFMIAGGGRGTWQLDGYLLSLHPTGAPGWITTISGTGKKFGVIGTTLYTREK